MLLPSRGYNKDSLGAANGIMGLPASKSLLDLFLTSRSQMAKQILDNTSKYHLWVDRVGGFLVCLQDRVLIGQAIPNHQVDIPILGDLSREHAVIIRDGEDYLLESVAPTWIADRRVNKPTRLDDGGTIRLGEHVTMRFRLPNPLSQSARLEFVSRHDLQPSVDAVLLMSESLILGSQPNHHVVCPQWSDSVALARSTQAKSLRYRAGVGVEINNESAENMGILAAGAQLTGSDFALSLEAF